MRGIRGVVAALAVALVLGACGGDDAQAETTTTTTEATTTTTEPVYDLSGSLTLNDVDVRGVGSRCAGTGGYSDISDGAQVKVVDGEGSTLGLGQLNAATRTNAFSCSFFFEVRDLPRTDFYEVTAAGREGISYTFNDMQSMRWDVELSLG